MNRLYKIKAITAALIISCLLVLLPGCEKKGEAEQAGEKIDNALENIGEKLEETGDKITNDGPVENLGENIDETIENKNK